MSEKKPRPATCCTNCGAPGYDTRAANRECGWPYDWEKCRGTKRSAANEGDWIASGEETSGKIPERIPPEFRRALEDNHIIVIGWRDIKELLN